MRRQKNQMPIESMQAHRENTAKTPGKSGRFARRALLGAALFGAIAAPLVLNAQKSANTALLPSDVKNKLGVAAVDSKLPAKTYVMGKDTLKTMASVDARAKPAEVKDAAKANETPAPVVNKLGQTIIGEPFCDVRFEGEKVIFENIKLANQNIMMTDEVHSEVRGDFQKDATIVFVKQNKSVFVHNGLMLAQYRFTKDSNEVGDVRLDRISVTESRGNNHIEKTAIIAKDGSLVIFPCEQATLIYETAKDKKNIHELSGRIFTHPGAIYEDIENGIFVATTPTELFVKINEKVFLIVYNTRWGDGPALVKPIITRLDNNDIELTDSTMPEQRILIDSKTGANGLFDIPKKPTTTIGMK